MKESNRQAFSRGFCDGIPIGLGYLAVSFSIGIAARNIGLNAFQGFLMSLLNNCLLYTSLDEKEVINGINFCFYDRICIYRMWK